MSENLKHTCHECGKVLTYPPEWAGDTVECSHCGKETCLGERYPSAAPVAAAATPTAKRRPPPAPKLTLSKKTQPTDPSAPPPPPAPMAAATPCPPQSDRYLDALERSAAHEQGRDAEVPRSIALFVTALFNFGIGIFWVIIGGSEFLPGSDVRPVTAYWIMVAGMLFLAAGVGLLARMPTARGFVFFVHPLWVIYMIVGMFRSEVELWLGILAILLHGVTWIPACFCSQDFVHGDGEVANPLGQVTVFLFALFLIVVVGIGLWISIASGPSLPQQKY